MGEGGQRAFPRPREVTMAEETKSTEAMTERDVAEQAAQLAASYLEHQGYEVLDASSMAQVVARDGGDHVIVAIRGAAGECDGMPDLDLDGEGERLLRRSCLLYAADHPEAEAVRADAIAIAIVGEGRARLRHLIGAYRWAESE